MNKATILATALSICCSSVNAQENASFIGKSNITLQSDLMTPEALWAMVESALHRPRQMENTLSTK